MVKLLRAGVARVVVADLEHLDSVPCFLHGPLRASVPYISEGTERRSPAMAWRSCWYSSSLGSSSILISMASQTQRVWN